MVPWWIELPFGVPKSIQISFQDLINPDIFVLLMTSKCEAPLEIRGYRNPYSHFIRPEYREAVLKANAIRKELLWDQIPILNEDNFSK